MNEQIMEEILKRLDVLAIKLGTTGELLWTVLIKQAHIEGYLCILKIVLPSIALLALFRKLKSIIAFVKKHDDEDGFVSHLIAPVGGLVITVFAIALICAGVSNIWVLLNPEYFALLKIL